MVSASSYIDDVEVDDDDDDDEQVLPSIGLISHNSFVCSKHIHLMFNRVQAKKNRISAPILNIQEFTLMLIEEKPFYIAKTLTKNISKPPKNVSKPPQKLF